MTGDLTRPPAMSGAQAPLTIVERYSREIRFALRIMLLAATGALAVPVCAWAWSLTSTPFAWFDGVLSPEGVEALRPSQWLTWGHAAITTLFLITNLVCRRYGSGWALVHVLFSTLWAVGGLTAVSLDFVQLDPGAAVQLSAREVLSLLIALTVGQAASVFVFEHTRGVEWWNAPAYAALTATLIASPLFHALAYTGTDWIWLHRMSIDVALKALMAFALLVPYYLLRPVVHPREGMGGY